jgi:hypothetical protein
MYTFARRVGVRGKARSQIEAQPSALPRIPVGVRESASGFEPDWAEPSFEPDWAQPDLDRASHCRPHCESARRSGSGTT